MKIKKYQFGGPSDYFNWLTMQLSGSNSPILTGVSLHLNNAGPALLILGTPIITNYPTSPNIPSTLDTSGLNDKINLVQQTKSSTGNLILASGIQAAGLIGTEYLSDKLFDLSTDWGRGLGTLFSLGSSAALGTMSSNLLKGKFLTEGLGLNVGASLGGTAAGLAGNYIGQGISSLGGNSMLSRGIGAGVGTAIGGIGGMGFQALSKGKGFFDAFKIAKNANAAAEAAKAAGLTDKIKDAFNLSKATSWANIGGLAGSVVGAGLSAAFGPSKEYAGKYGNITRTMDSIYDVVQAGVGFIPGVGTAISGAMALNKGLSNIFGSTDGMTVQDSILGSAFMPAPVKWLNMAGASKTGTFNNQSWQNTEKANSFMGNAFGNLNDRFDTARAEAGKTYGTFSKGARNSAQENIDFANYAWDKVLAMADLNELLNIRSLYMSSINNLRYAQEIGGVWLPIYRGKQGMKILNNATNHNMGMRLLSAAALIDNKQIILCSVVD